MSKDSNKVIILLFAAINGIVLYNAVFHPPWIGYDAIEHIKNIIVLSTFRLPTPGDTYMFYMPPLGYSLPALLFSSKILPIILVLKFAQLLNVLFSVGLMYYLLKICDIIRPQKTQFKIISLLFLGMMPVYYKTFALIRGEPLAAFLTVFAAYKTLVIFVKRNHDMHNIVTLGITLGLIILSRQTGFFVFPAIIVFAALCTLKKQNTKIFFVKAVSLIFLIALLTGGWYYVHLYRTYGTAASYNVPSAKKFSFSNQPPHFYFGLELQKLFSDPVRSAFMNQFIPVFYSECWGDYLCYFVIYGKNVTDGKFISGNHLEYLLNETPVPGWLKTNRYTINSYLGRVNLVALFSSMILVAGFILGAAYLLRHFFERGPSAICASFSLIELTVIFSFMAYFYYLIMYPSLEKGDNIKASYMLHVYPFIALLAGEFIYRIKEKSDFWYKAILILLVLSVMHNCFAFLTHYTPWQ